MTSPTAAEEYRLREDFQSVRASLLDEKYADRLDQPLAHWVLVTDRRLPFSLLEHTLAQLLATPFDQLAATSGIGPKKMNTLVTLLQRAVNDDAVSQAVVVIEPASVAHASENGNAASHGLFDPLAVSETLWKQWRDLVENFNLHSEKLGRLTPTLQSLPTALWNTPLSAYVNHSLAEIRRLKTHGEKRVNGIVEVFFEINKMLTGIDSNSLLGPRLAPRHILAAEAWITAITANSTCPSAAELRERLTMPLIQQIHVDAGSTLGRLVESRLGIDCEPQTVFTLAQQFSVTRARIYQYFEECAKIMNVRWPEGKSQLAKLATLYSGNSADQNDLTLLNSIRDLFYPK